MKKTVWLEQVEGGWLRVEGEKTEIKFMLNLIEKWNSHLCL